MKVNTKDLIGPATGRVLLKAEIYDRVNKETAECQELVVYYAESIRAAQIGGM